MSYARCPGGACRHGHGDGCLAVRTGHWRICELADPAHPEHAPGILAQLSPDAKPAGPDPLMVAVDLCPDRLSCQCREPIACRIKGPGTLARCLECRRAASPA